MVNDVKNFAKLKASKNTKLKAYKNTKLKAPKKPLYIFRRICYNIMWCSFGCKIFPI